MRGTSLGAKITGKWCFFFGFFLQFVIPMFLVVAFLGALLYYDC